MKTRLGPKPFLFPMPAALIGTYGENQTPNAMTAAWTAVCSKEPLHVGVAIRKSRQTYVNMNRTKAFTLAVPKSTMSTPVDYLGIVSGAKVPNKLEVAGINTTRGDKVDAPILVECPVNMECKLVTRIPLGTHDWCIGEVLEVQVDEEVCDPDGKLDVDLIDPLVYTMSASEYRSLGEVVGSAFRDGKKLIHRAL